MRMNQGRVNMASKSGRIRGYFTCVFCKETFEGDKRSICCDNPECQEKQNNKRKALVRKSLKRNRKKRIKNRCIICRKNKGANRFYCKTCHSRLSKECGSEEYSTARSIDFIS